MIDENLGHVPRCKPIRLQSGEVLFGTEYLDNRSRILASRDEGHTWEVVGAISGEPNQHPALMERSDGSILALLRPSSSVLWYVIVGSTLRSLAVAGRFYCGWLCPFGALSELVARFPLRKWTVPPELDGRWRDLKYALLAVVTAVVFLGGRVDLGNYEAYITLFAFHGNTFAWARLAP